MTLDRIISNLNEILDIGGEVKNLQLIGSNASEALSAVEKLTGAIGEIKSGSLDSIGTTKAFIAGFSAFETVSEKLLRFNLQVGVLRQGITGAISAVSRLSGVAGAIDFGSALSGSSELSNSFEGLISKANIIDTVFQQAFDFSSYASELGALTQGYAQQESAAFRLATITVQGQRVTQQAIRRTIQDARELSASGNFKFSSREILGAQFSGASAGFTKSSQQKDIATAAQNLALVSSVGSGRPAGENLQRDAEVLTQITSTLGESTSNAGKRASQLFKTNQLAITTPEELNNFAPQLAQTAATAKLNPEEVLGAFTQLTRSGLSTNEASISIQNLIDDIITENNNADKLLGGTTTSSGKAFKLNFSSLQERGLQGTIEDIQDVTGGNEQLQSKVFGNLYSGRALRNLAKNSTELSNVTGEISDSRPEELSNLAKDSEQTFEVKFQQAKNATYEGLSRNAENASVVFKDLLGVVPQVASGLGSITAVTGKVEGALNGVGGVISGLGGILSSAFSIGVPLAFLAVIQQAVGGIANVGNIAKRALGEFSNLSPIEIARKAIDALESTVAGFLARVQARLAVIRGEVAALNASAGGGGAVGANAPSPNAQSVIDATRDESSRSSSPVSTPTSNPPPPPPLLTRAEREAKATLASTNDIRDKVNNNSLKVGGAALGVSAAASLAAQTVGTDKEGNTTELGKFLQGVSTAGIVVATLFVPAISAAVTGLSLLASTAASNAGINAANIASKLPTTIGGVLAGLAGKALLVTGAFAAVAGAITLAVVAFNNFKDFQKGTNEANNALFEAGNFAAVAGTGRNVDQAILDRNRTRVNTNETPEQRKRREDLQKLENSGRDTGSIASLDARDRGFASTAIRANLGNAIYRNAARDVIETGGTDLTSFAIGNAATTSRNADARIQELAKNPGDSKELSEQLFIRAEQQKILKQAPAAAARSNAGIATSEDIDVLTRNPEIQVKSLGVEIDKNKRVLEQLEKDNPEKNKDQIAKIKVVVEGDTVQLETLQNQIKLLRDTNIQSTIKAVLDFRRSDGNVSTQITKQAESSVQQNIKAAQDNARQFENPETRRQAVANAPIVAENLIASFQNLLKVNPEKADIGSILNQAGTTAKALIALNPESRKIVTEGLKLATETQQQLGEFKANVQIGNTSLFENQPGLGRFSADIQKTTATQNAERLRSSAKLSEEFGDPVQAQAFLSAAADEDRKALQSGITSEIARQTEGLQRQKVISDALVASAETRSRILGQNTPIGDIAGVEARNKQRENEISLRNTPETITAQAAVTDAQQRLSQNPNDSNSQEQLNTAQKNLANLLNAQKIELDASNLQGAFDLASEQIKQNFQSFNILQTANEQYADSLAKVASSVSSPVLSANLQRQSVQARNFNPVSIATNNRNQTLARINTNEQFRLRAATNETQRQGIREESTLARRNANAGFGQEVLTRTNELLSANAQVASKSIGQLSEAAKSAGSAVEDFASSGLSAIGSARTQVSNTGQFASAVFGQEVGEIFNLANLPKQQALNEAENQIQLAKNATDETSALIDVEVLKQQLDIETQQLQALGLIAQKLGADSAGTITQGAERSKQINTQLQTGLDIKKDAIGFNKTAADFNANNQLIANNQKDASQAGLPGNILALGSATRNAPETTKQALDIASTATGQINRSGRSLKEVLTSVETIRGESNTENQKIIQGTVSNINPESQSNKPNTPIGNAPPPNTTSTPNINTESNISNTPTTSSEDLPNPFPNYSQPKIALPKIVGYTPPEPKSDTQPSASTQGKSVAITISPNNTYTVTVNGVGADGKISSEQIKELSDKLNKEQEQNLLKIATNLESIIKTIV